jgi:hypothetical protein
VLSEFRKSFLRAKLEWRIGTTKIMQVTQQTQLNDSVQVAHGDQMRE